MERAMPGDVEYSVLHTASEAESSGYAEASAYAVKAVETLKEAFWQADQVAIGNDGKLPQAMAAQLCEAFLTLIRQVDDLIGDRADIDAASRLRIAAYLRRELLPFHLPHRARGADVLQA